MNASKSSSMKEKESSATLNMSTNDNHYLDGIQLLADPCVVSSIHQMDLSSVNTRMSKYLITFLCWTGLVPQNKDNSYSKKWIVFLLILLLGIVDNLSTLLVNLDSEQLKKKVAHFLPEILSLVIWYAARRQRAKLKTMLQKLQDMPPSKFEKTLGFLIFFVSSIPWVGPTLFTIQNKPKIVYGFELKGPLGQFLLWIRSHVHLIMYPTFPCLIALLYCIACLRCSRSMKSLSQVINRFTPEAFRTSEQLSILRYKAKIDDVLDDIQEVFSVPSLFLILANFSSCCRIFGWNVLEFESDKKIVKTTFYAVVSFTCLSGTLWMASGVSTELNNMKKIFHKKSHLRLLFVRTPKETQYKKELMGEPNFVLSGCDIIFYRRSTLLTIMGALLTYTILVIGL
ncbi:uncharacterized protein NPIL_386621 [Nephila pilipes]|uniref:Uncharacterized protein n=1 Tax=Nephila pilipes TaxID=299642 RepID=A0A8X6NZT5_NEPPI|nr:uncharacterized protein NPIL_386621 [Nephila pilipes]